MAVKNVGELDFENANDSNIPVSIFLTKLDEPEEDDRALKDEDDDSSEAAFYPWKLTADNFMPRRGRANEGAYIAFADTREELAELIKQHVKPLYEVALGEINKMIVGNASKLYYWEAEK